MNKTSVEIFISSPSFPWPSPPLPEQGFVLALRQGGARRRQLLHEVGRRQLAPTASPPGDLGRRPHRPLHRVHRATPYTTYYVWESELLTPVPFPCTVRWDAGKCLAQKRPRSIVALWDSFKRIWEEEVASKGVSSLEWTNPSFCVPLCVPQSS